MDPWILARHGLSTDNEQRRISGRRDPPLAAAGREHARHLAGALAGHGVGAVFTSPLRRARDTAIAVAAALDVPLVVIDELAEVGFGELEGRRRDALDEGARRQLAAWRGGDPGLAVEGGESRADLSARIARARDAIDARLPQGTGLVVGHRYALRALLAELLDWDWDRVGSIRIRTRYAFIVDRRSRPPSVATLRTEPPRLGKVYRRLRD